MDEVTSSSSSTATVSEELSECIQRIRSVLRDHVRLLDGLIAALLDHRPSLRLRTEDAAVPAAVASALAPMIQAAGSSSNTVILLSDSPGLQTRDCYSVGRSVVEIAINICFILAEGEPAAEQAARHARQKAYRDLERESVIGDNVIRLMYDGAPDPSTIERLQEDLDEFTSGSGREKGWTAISVDDRIARVGTHLGQSIVTSLHWARFALYRHSSEILHGTLFGALFFFGQTSPSPPKSLREFSESIGQQHMMILLACVLALSAVVESFHSVYGFSSAQEESQRLVKSLGEIKYFRRGSAK